MSEGMRQLLEEARETGYRSGKEEGYRSGLLAGKQNTLWNLVLKRSQKGDTPEEIADLLEIEIVEVFEILKQASDLK